MRSQEITNRARSISASHLPRASVTIGGGTNTFGPAGDEQQALGLWQL